jgi:hypothetical protein
MADQWWKFAIVEHARRLPSALTLTLGQIPPARPVSRGAAPLLPRIGIRPERGKLISVDFSIVKHARGLPSALTLTLGQILPTTL